MEEGFQKKEQEISQHKQLPIRAMELILNTGRQSQNPMRMFKASSYIVF
jgi:hypothetical protein